MNTFKKNPNPNFKEVNLQTRDIERGYGTTSRCKVMDFFCKYYDMKGN